jgi:hypothetical protein
MPIRNTRRRRRAFRSCGEISRSITSALRKVLCPALGKTQYSDRLT